MRFIGIDVGSERHTVAIVDEHGRPLLRSVSITEDAAGFESYSAIQPIPSSQWRLPTTTGGTCLVGSRPKVPRLPCSIPSERGVLLKKNCSEPKTDHIDALGIARFAAQKRPKATQISDQTTQELRQLVHFRQQAVQHLEDRVRNLHRAIDLTFPEFTRHVRGLDTELATAILSRYPSARALSMATIPKLARLCFDGRRRVGYPLARELVEAAKQSVGSLQTAPFELEVRYACLDIDEMRERSRQLEADIQRRIDSNDLGKLLTTIQGVSTLTAATIIAETGDLARFPNTATFASYVGVVPRLHQSGKRRFSAQMGRSRSATLGSGGLSGCRCLWRHVSTRGYELTIGDFARLANARRLR